MKTVLEALDVPEEASYPEVEGWQRSSGKPRGRGRSSWGHQQDDAVKITRETLRDIGWRTDDGTLTASTGWVQGAVVEVHGGKLSNLLLLKPLSLLGSTKDRTCRPPEAARVTPVFALQRCWTQACL